MTGAENVKTNPQIKTCIFSGLNFFWKYPEIDLMYI